MVTKCPVCRSSKITENKGKISCKNCDYINKPTPKEEFKTLKDFESNDESVDLLMEVRKEGIKWVKELPHLITKDDWFNFFNITAEDLK